MDVCPRRSSRSDSGRAGRRARPRPGELEVGPWVCGRARWTPVGGSVVRWPRPAAATGGRPPRAGAARMRGPRTTWDAPLARPSARLPPTQPCRRRHRRCGRVRAAVPPARGGRGLRERRADVLVGPRDDAAEVEPGARPSSAGRGRPVLADLTRRPHIASGGDSGSARASASEAAWRHEGEPRAEGAGSVRVDHAPIAEEGVERGREVGGVGGDPLRSWAAAVSSTTSGKRGRAGPARLRESSSNGGCDPQGVAPAPRRLSEDRAIRACAYWT